MIDLTKKKENILPRKRGNWIDLQNKSGVYIFSKKDTVLYVGRSNNLYQRMNNHYSRGGICHAFEWDAIHYIFCENHKIIERQVINILNPLYNGYLTSKFYYS